MSESATAILQKSNPALAAEYAKRYQASKAAPKKGCGCGVAKSSQRSPVAKGPPSLPAFAVPPMKPKAPTAPAPKVSLSQATAPKPKAPAAPAPKVSLPALPVSQAKPNTPNAQIAHLQLAREIAKKRAEAKKEETKPAPLAKIEEKKEEAKPVPPIAPTPKVEEQVVVNVTVEEKKEESSVPPIAPTPKVEEQVVVNIAVEEAKPASTEVKVDIVQEVQNAQPEAKKEEVPAQPEVKKEEVKPEAKKEEVSVPAPAQPGTKAVVEPKAKSRITLSNAPKLAVRNAIPKAPGQQGDAQLNPRQCATQ